VCRHPYELGRRPGRRTEIGLTAAPAAKVDPIARPSRRSSYFGSVGPGDSVSFGGTANLSESGRRAGDSIVDGGVFDAGLRRVSPGDGSHPLGEKLIGRSNSARDISERFLIVTLPNEIPSLG
jgi:hypothetical protein